MLERLRALRLVRASRCPLAHDRANWSCSATTASRRATSRSIRSTKSSRSIPTRSTGAFSRMRRRWRPQAGAQGAGARAGLEAHDIDARRRQHLHRLSLPRAHRAMSSSARAARGRAGATTWSDRAAPPRCRTCSIGRALLDAGAARARALDLRRGEQRRDVPRRRSRRADQRLPVRRWRRRGGAVARAAPGEPARSSGATPPR